MHHPPWGPLVADTGGDLARAYIDDPIVNAIRSPQVTRRSAESDRLSGHVF
jgi:hypothetical protein